MFRRHTSPVPRPAAALITHPEPAPPARCGCGCRPAGARAAWPTRTAAAAATTPLTLSATRAAGLSSAGRRASASPSRWALRRAAGRSASGGACVWYFAGKGRGGGARLAACNHVQLHASWLHASTYSWHPPQWTSWCGPDRALRSETSDGLHLDVHCSGRQLRDIPPRLGARCIPPTGHRLDCMNAGAAEAHLPAAQHRHHAPCACLPSRRCASPAVDRTLPAARRTPCRFPLLR